MTPTRPLPAAASGFNFAISVKFTLKDVTLRPAGTVAVAAVVSWSPPWECCYTP